MKWIPIFEGLVLGYFSVLNLIYLTFTIISFRHLVRYQRRLGERRSRALLSDAIYRPISVLVPAHNEQETIVANVESLLTMGYPEFEVIVIDDGSEDGTLEELRKAFDLAPKPSATRIQLPSKRVLWTYRSLDRPNLVVLQKEHGGKSDALNAGINASRYPLFCSLDADSILDSDSLLRIARAFADDERIVGAGGIVRVLNGAEVVNGRVVASHAPTRPLLLCQSQEYIRAFLAGRSALAGVNSLLILAGAFSLFRKEAVIEIGGYSSATVCEDLELVVRLHQSQREAGRDGRIIFVPDPVCWTQVPSEWKCLIAQRDRWHRGLLESLWLGRRMMLRKKFGAVGFIAMPYYLFEALGPIVETAGYVSVLVLLLLGVLDFQFLLLFLMLSVFFGVLLSIAALNLDDLLVRRYDSGRDLARLMLGSVLEFLGFRQLLVGVRAVSCVRVLFARRTWGRVAREKLDRSRVRETVR